VRGTTTTTGWTPGCECAAGDPVPCTVLDPFAGSGTTLAVANSIGRASIGIELKPEYVELARKRIAAGCSDKMDVDPSDAPLFQTDLLAQSKEPPAI
jgi:tRNA/tmRNA/rRNA uracil-C5-methylase (TrmA/RlmC/RlmD family)